MHPVRKKRVLLIAGIGAGIVMAIIFVLLALKQNINLFYTPTQVFRGEAPAQRTFRMGGLVVPGSINRSGEKLDVWFSLTDTAKTIQVHYRGALPDLFKAGQGVVVTGRLSSAKQFEASEVLAKHDENYMPPPVAQAIAKAKSQKTPLEVK